MKTETIFRSVEERKDDAGVVGDVPDRVIDRREASDANEQEHEFDAELCAAGSDRHPEWYIG